MTRAITHRRADLRFWSSAPPPPAILGTRQRRGCRDSWRLPSLPTSAPVSNTRRQRWTGWRSHAPELDRIRAAAGQSLPSSGSDRSPRSRIGGVAAPSLCVDIPADIGFPKLNEPAAAPAMLAPAVEAAPEAEGGQQAAAAEELRAAERRADRRGSRSGSKLTSSQDHTGRRWRPRLRGVARARSTRRGRATRPPAAAQIDPDSEEVQQLKSAAMPLLFQLREDQKREVRSLARIIGLEKGRRDDLNGLDQRPFFFLPLATAVVRVLAQRAPAV